MSDERITKLTFSFKVMEWMIRAQNHSLSSINSGQHFCLTHVTIHYYGGSFEKSYHNGFMIAMFTLLLLFSALIFFDKPIRSAKIG
jgi:hypothetical protein